MNTAVLLATYNGEAYLPELLSSLSAQTRGDFSVLYQDDGSSDATPRLLREYAAKDRRFSPASRQGEHLGAAGNFLSLLSQAEDTDRVLFCDQDDVWDKDKVESLLSALGKAEERFGAGTPLLVHSDCRIIDSSGKVTADSFFALQGWDPAAVTLPRLLVQNNVTGCTLVMNRALADLVRAYARAEKLFMHDWFAAMTAAAFGRIVFLPRALTSYRQHGGNAVGASRRSLPARAFSVLRHGEQAKQRILLTYTNARSFLDCWEHDLPEAQEKIVLDYLSTRDLPKVRRVLAVRKQGCVMQSRLTRLGQLLFG